MKSKPEKKPEPELEIERDEDEEDADIESGGPAIAAAKKSKVMVIAASSLLVTLVIYFFFFKAPSKDAEKLQPVEVPKASNVAGSDSGKSPFEIETPKEAQDDSDANLLTKPAVPDVPTLPELPKDASTPDAISISSDPTKPDPAKTNPNQATNPQQAQQQVGQPQQPGQAPQQAANQAQQTTPADAPKKDLDPRYAPIVVFSGGTGPSRGVGYDKNIVDLSTDPIASLQKTAPGVNATYIDDKVHTVAQGKLLTAVLETAINTELPGAVRAVVSRDVYGESGSEVLIPRGSRLFGAYSSQITRGQGRVEIGWSRLIRPDGVDLSIAFRASDQFGRSGIPGDVDNKYNSIVANSLLTSILAVGGVAAAQSILGNQATTVTTNPGQGTTTTTGNATNQAVYDVTKSIIDTVGQVAANSININPVIRVPQGTRITVIVNSDINIPSMKRR